jgi:hypothetical protein
MRSVGASSNRDRFSSKAYNPGYDKRIERVVPNFRGGTPMDERFSQSECPQRDESRQRR